ncbi:MAG: hypothetical protein JXA67_22265 [Micromonosporaceae bacterium]|nr:hypothetical protein [Micromonosporaceae bacterium]
MEAHALGTMADPGDLVEALRVLGLIERVLTPAEAAAEQERAGGLELWRLEVAHTLAGVVEMQTLMATTTAADAGADPTRINLAPARAFFGANVDVDDDLARVTLLRVLADRLQALLMISVARWKRGEGAVPRLVLPAFLTTTAVEAMLAQAATEPGGRAPALDQIAGQLRGALEMIEEWAAAERRTATEV